VQVWLRTAAREGAFEWSGSLAPAPPGKPHPDPLPFEPAHPRVAGARHASDEVRVRPIDGWEARADRFRGWQALPGTPGELHFRTEAPGAPGLRVRLSPTRPFLR
jgi:hypothetical protein